MKIIMPICYIGTLAIKKLPILLGNMLVILLFVASINCRASDGVYVGLVPLSDEVLGSMRGGFITPDGLEITLGIEDLILINGMLQSRFALDLERLNDPVAASSMGDDIKGFMNVTNVGSGNGVPDVLNSTGSSAVMNVIQNSLNNQTIHHLTALNITVSNIGNYRMPDFGRMIDFQVTQSLGSLR